MTIPILIKASVALASGERYSGAVAIAELSRLGEQLSQASGELAVELRAATNIGGDWLNGSIRGPLMLSCRRCLQPFCHELNQRVSLQLVASEAEEARVLHDSEPYLVIDDQLPLLELIEDEVLLALPMLPRCESCENAVRESEGKAVEDVSAKRPNPFDQLKNLKF